MQDTRILMQKQYVGQYKGTNLSKTPLKNIIDQARDPRRRPIKFNLPAETKPVEQQKKDHKNSWSKISPVDRLPIMDFLRSSCFRLIGLSSETYEKQTKEEKDKTDLYVSHLVEETRTKVCERFDRNRGTDYFVGFNGQVLESVVDVPRAYWELVLQEKIFRRKLDKFYAQQAAAIQFSPPASFQPEANQEEQQPQSMEIENGTEEEPTEHLIQEQITSGTMETEMTEVVVQEFQYLGITQSDYQQRNLRYDKRFGEYMKDLFQKTNISGKCLNVEFTDDPSYSSIVYLKEAMIAREQFSVHFSLKAIFNRTTDVKIRFPNDQIIEGTLEPYHGYLCGDYPPVIVGNFYKYQNQLTITVSRFGVP
jgi:hypothetical protein